MRIHTVKKNIRSNHTIRWGGFCQDGTKRNGIVDGMRFIHYMTDYSSVATTINNKKYKKDFPLISSNNEDNNDVDNNDDKFILNIEPSRNQIIRYDSTVKCCQKCGGTRFACKAVFCETNQFGKGIYRQGKKYRDNPRNHYDEYTDGIDDAYWEIEQYDYESFRDHFWNESVDYD